MSNFFPIKIKQTEAIDGLYQVTTKYLCVGFVIENGKLIICASILRKRFSYWKTIAIRIGD